MENFIKDPFKLFMYAAGGIAVVMLLAMCALLFRLVFDGFPNPFAPRLATCGITNMYVGDKVGMPDGDYVITDRDVLKSIGVVHLTATKVNYDD